MDKHPNTQVQRYADGKYENASTIHCPGHIHPNFLAATARWYVAVAGEIKDYLAPKGNISLVQLYNEIPCDDHDDQNPKIWDRQGKRSLSSGDSWGYNPYPDARAPFFSSIMRLLRRELQ